MAIPDCPSSPNCVSTVAGNPRRRLSSLRFQTSIEEARAAAREILLSMPRARLVTQEQDYLHLEFRSRFFQFVDDVELAFDASRGRIDFRSASRQGYYDFGVNRRRMKKMIRRLIRRPGISMWTGNRSGR